MAATDLRKKILETPEAARKTPEFARLLNDLAVACHNSRYGRKDKRPHEDIAPIQAERLFSNTTLEHFGAYVLDLRSRVEAGFPEAKNELQLVIERLGPWYHNLTFAGTSTLSATPDYPASRWSMLEPLIPEDLRGKTVLDIGCNSGFFSVEMKKRGAARVVGIDTCRLFWRRHDSLPIGLMFRSNFMK